MASYSELCGAVIIMMTYDSMDMYGSSVHRNESTGKTHILFGPVSIVSPVQAVMLEKAQTCNLPSTKDPLNYHVFD